MQDKQRLDPGPSLAVIVGLTLGILLITELAATERRRLGEQAGEQRSIVTLSAFTQLVTATHALSGDLQQAVTAFAASHDDVVLATAYDFRNRELLASTDPQYASGPWPQRLERRDPSRKSWTELGSRLRSALELNGRQRQSVREEISVERLDSGHLALAAPIAYGDNIHPIVVLLEARGEAVHLDGVPILAGILILVVPVLFLILSGRLQLGNGQSAIAVVLVVGVTLGVFFYVTDRDLASADRAVQEQVETRLLAEYQRLQDLGLDPQTLAPETWDVDRFRRPRGISAEPQQRFRQRGAGAVILALALSALMGWFRTFNPRSTIDTTDAKPT